MTVAPLIAEASETGITPSIGLSTAGGYRLAVIDPTVDPAWDRLVASHPAATIFHSSAWMRVLCETYGHKPIGLVWSNNGEAKALLPLLEVASILTGRRGVCLPFTDFCEPLFFDGFDSTVLLQELQRLARESGWQAFEIRGGLGPSLPARPSLVFCGHSLDLRAGAKSLFQNFAGSVRRAIGKAERSGLRVELSASEEAVRDFYRLHVRTRRRHGLPPQPFSFFRKIHDHVIKPGLGLVSLARSGSDTVAAAVFFCLGTKAVYKFGASDDRYSNTRPNNLVMWHAIQQLADAKVTTLHLGRTSPHNEGLRRFKLGWGATEKPISYFRFDVRSNRWATMKDRSSGIHNALFKRLPLIANRLAGAALYPHLD
jgi:CelD/BcsL family acetyltransferase involved in cellulose biosynthesis